MTHTTKTILMYTKNSHPSAYRRIAVKALQGGNPNEAVVLATRLDSSATYYHAGSSLTEKDWAKYAPLVELLNAAADDSSAAYKQLRSKLSHI